MIRIRVASFMLLMLLEAALAQEHNSCPKGFHTLYSQKAASLNPAFDHAVRLMSPDRKKTLLVRTVEGARDPDGVHISYKVKVAGKTFRTTLLGFNSEVAWAPDSRAFAVTQTEGGGGLGSRVYVFFVDENGIRKLDVSRPVEKDFGRPVRCDVAVPPNTGFISWKTDSSKLLVAAEVVRVSACDCSGTYRVYEMDLPALTIAKTYSQKAAKTQFWNLLGCELRDADDRCVNVLERHHRHPIPSGDVAADNR